MKTEDRIRLAELKGNLANRLAPGGGASGAPMLGARDPHYEVSCRVRATGAGGVAAFLAMARSVGLVDALDERVRVFKRRLVYHESDHVLSLALSALAGGTCLDDTRLLRKDEAFLDSVGADRIPDATTLGDFMRRFESADDVVALIDAINSVRPALWRRGLTKEQRETAYLDVDGVIAPTCGECKEGMEVAFNGVWGYHPLIVSLANTREPLLLVNRPGNRPSDDGAAVWVDRAIDLVSPAFESVCIRGDTAFYRMSDHFDRWDQRGVRFIIGARIRKSLQARFEAIPDHQWEPYDDRNGEDPATGRRKKRRRVKQEIVAAKGYRDLRLNAEHVAEIDHRPGRCEKAYRLVVLRKNITVSEAQTRLFDEIRYFAYITNDWNMPAEEVVRHNHARCEQENLIEQLKNGLNALRMPVGDLNSNWAFMVIASLAWSLKAWFALLAPPASRTSLLRMEFRGFINSFVHIPAQVVLSGRRLIVRLLTYRDSLLTFLTTCKTIRRLRPT
ncbi:MAG: IS1380 family transposase [Actinomycetota bacterium]